MLLVALFVLLVVVVELVVLKDLLGGLHTYDYPCEGSCANGSALSPKRFYLIAYWLHRNAIYETQLGTIRRSSAAKIYQAPGRLCNFFKAICIPRFQ